MGVENIRAAQWIGRRRASARLHRRTHVRAATHLDNTLVLAGRKSAGPSLCGFSCPSAHIMMKTRDVSAPSLLSTKRVAERLRRSAGRRSGRASSMYERRVHRFLPRKSARLARAPTGFRRTQGVTPKVQYLSLCELKIGRLLPPIQCTEPLKAPLVAHSTKGECPPQTRPTIATRGCDGSHRV